MSSRSSRYKATTSDVRSPLCLNPRSRFPSSAGGGERPSCSVMALPHRQPTPTSTGPPTSDLPGLGEAARPLSSSSLSSGGPWGGAGVFGSYTQKSADAATNSWKNQNTQQHSQQVPVPFGAPFATTLATSVPATRAASGSSSGGVVSWGTQQPHSYGGGRGTVAPAQVSSTATYDGILKRDREGNTVTTPSHTLEGGPSIDSSSTALQELATTLHTAAGYVEGSEASLLALHRRAEQTMQRQAKQLEKVRQLIGGLHIKNKPTMGLFQSMTAVAPTPVPQLTPTVPRRSLL